VIVAAGKGEVNRMFERDAEKSPYDKPMRAQALTYVKKMTPRTPFTAVSFNLVPGVGEYFVFPALTKTGPCEIMVFEGVPGGPMDCWNDVKTPQEHLAQSKWILENFIPLEADRCKNVELTDDTGILVGRFAPTVRKPVSKLSGGRLALGMGDVVATNDPITGQGSNTAARAATIYLKRILEHGNKAFDGPWMQETFDIFWDYTQWVVNWTNSLLIPPAPQILRLMGAASQIPPLASRIANGFNNPADYAPWWFDSGKAHELIKSLSGAAV
jgi:Styrene monooxygenase A putative substrate binding domain